MVMKWRDRGTANHRHSISSWTVGDYQCLSNVYFQLLPQEDLPASLVLTPLEGALGSPVPIALLATTLNSYSTHGLSSTAMADSMSPVTGSGSAHKSVACVFIYSGQAEHYNYSIFSPPCEQYVRL